MAQLGLLIIAALAQILTTPGTAAASGVAVPEPATIVLLGAGVGAAGVAAWMKRRRKR